MRASIRFQMLFPLLPLVVGWLATTAWTAWSAASAARERIRRDMDQIAATVQAVTFPRNVQTLRLMKGLSGAELLLADGEGHPVFDDDGQPLTTLGTLPAAWPAAGAVEEPARVLIGATAYLGRPVRLQHD